MKFHKMVLWGVVLLTLLIPTSVGAAGDDIDRVIVALYDAQGQPLGGVDVQLVLYRFTGGEQVEATIWGHCTTKKAGSCEIRVQNAPRDDSGFFRGQLLVARYGDRSIIWPGGSLNVTLWLDESGALDIPGESVPYEGQEAVPSPEIVWKPRLRAANVIIPVLLIGGLLVFIWFRNKQR